MYSAVLLPPDSILKYESDLADFIGGSKADVIVTEMVKQLNILQFLYRKHQNKHVCKGHVLFSVCYDITFVKQVNHKDPYQLLCFDPYNKKIVRN